MSFIPRRHCLASAPTNRILSIYPYQNGSRRIESTVDGAWDLGSSEVRREAIQEPHFVPIEVITRVEPEVHLAFMRKRLISPTPERIRPHDESWLDVGAAAVVEVTSEEEDYPIESALLL